MPRMRTSEKMRQVVADKIVVCEKLLQEASSEQEKHDRLLVLATLKELLNEIDNFLNSLPYA